MQNLAEKIGLAILAGGEGKRLKTKETKVLVPLLGKKLLDFPLMTAKNFVQENKAQAFVGVVTGKFHEDILRHLQKENLDFPWQCVEQKEPKGTADALKTFFSLSEAQKTDYTFVLCGDTPLITESHLKTLWEHLQKNSSLQGVVASFHLANPTGYGRIKRAEKVGFHIVEEKEASLEEKKIKEVNSGLYLLRTSF
ncbi:MAG: NTP transferase domain-containing protein, partial [Bacteriovoracaceae bacterium]|nr:NTP transferase domain-containing protein [Bacteriovoracaceae bacterium]